MTFSVWSGSQLLVPASVFWPERPASDFSSKGGTAPFGRPRCFWKGACFLKRAETAGLNYLNIDRRLHWVHGFQGPFASYILKLAKPIRLWYLVIPARCRENSRYTTWASLKVLYTSLHQLVRSQSGDQLLLFWVLDDELGRLSFLEMSERCTNPTRTKNSHRSTDLWLGTSIAVTPRKSHEVLFEFGIATGVYRRFIPCSFLGNRVQSKKCCMLLVLEIDANIQDLSTHDIFPKVLFKHILTYPQSHSSHTVGSCYFMVVRVVWLYRSIFTCICSCCIHDVYLSPIDSIVNICIQNDCAQLHLKHHQRRIETARHRPPIDPQDRPANLYLFQWFNNSVFPCFFSPRKATPTNEPISTQRKHHLICQYNKLVLERILCHGTSNMGIMLQ